MFKQILSLLFFSSLIFSLNAQTYEDIFYNANKLYLEAKYEEASIEYLKITNIKLSSIYYNLASSYFMNKDIEYSLLWYERALKLSPFDKEIEATVEMHTGKKSNLKILKIFNYSFSFLFLIAITSLFLFLTLFIVYKKTVKDKIFKAIVVFIFVSIFSFLSLLLIYKTEAIDYIIITSPTELYRGNSKHSQSLINLTGGEKIKILEEYENWYYVKNISGLKGWVKKSKSEKI